jgi:predicted AAA+ superfamily ATPase
MNDLRFISKTPIDEKNDLVIFDEIQACPEALTSLKYVAEQLPQLALCCAGSLLGLHLGETSFPVGKVDFLHMSPMCFAEFLIASDDLQSLAFLNQCQYSDSISEIVHEHL